MTVKEVWGRIQAQDVFAIAHEGDTWMFQVPRSAVGRVIAEFWVQDFAGNIGYRSALLTIEHGTIKCIEWLKTGNLLMLPIDRPSIAMQPIDRGIGWADYRTHIQDITVKPYCVQLPHICFKMEV